MRGEDTSLMASPSLAVETPPRAWRRRCNMWWTIAQYGNTSTCVEKTQAADRFYRLLKKHLHVRGEDAQREGEADTSLETPPRAWRRQSVVSSTVHRLRNTSTCVEKTSFSTSISEPNWKHLHVRGEDSMHTAPAARQTETPPRAWRRPDTSPESIKKMGNTSTCVEKTLSTGRDARPTWKHLHVRGEDSIYEWAKGNNEETPPRAWRRRWGSFTTMLGARNTSTCVEKTRHQRWLAVCMWKHLHVRGEDPSRGKNGTLK